MAWRQTRQTRSGCDVQPKDTGHEIARENEGKELQTTKAIAGHLTLRKRPDFQGANHEEG